MTLDLAEELEALVSALNEAGVDDALCGGLAMAVHGVPRATVDIDMMVPRQEAETILKKIRSSPQDRADIERLEDHADT